MSIKFHERDNDIYSQFLVCRGEYAANVLIYLNRQCGERLVSQVYDQVVRLVQVKNEDSYRELEEFLTSSPSSEALIREYRTESKIKSYLEGWTGFWTERTIKMTSVVGGGVPGILIGGAVGGCFIPVAPPIGIAIGGAIGGAIGYKLAKPCVKRFAILRLARVMSERLTGPEASSFEIRREIDSFNGWFATTKVLNLLSKYCDELGKPLNKMLKDPSTKELFKVPVYYNSKIEEGSKLSQEERESGNYIFDPYYFGEVIDRIESGFAEAQEESSKLEDLCNFARAEISTMTGAYMKKTTVENVIKKREIKQMYKRCT